MTDLAMAAPASALSIDPASIQIPGLPSLQEILLLDALGRMPDESILEPALAALYLRVSEQTLARLRSEGGGPDYSQPKEGGRNAKVSYRMEDLRRWHRSGKVSSTMEAAKSRGLCFASLMDLATPQPFWQSAAGQLDSPALVGSASRFDEKSAVLEIAWLSVIEAMGMPWFDTEARALFQDAYSELLRDEASRSRAIQEEFELFQLTASSD